MRDPGRTVRLGFAVGSGEPVDLPIRHMCVTGQTQESGKTTTLEALVARAGVRALTFVTKPGEAAFAKATHEIGPYFREQTEQRWRFVSAILEAHLGERLKFERNWISRAAEGTKTLEQVRANAWRLAETSKGPMNQDQFRMLGVYLDELVPAIAAVRWASKLELRAGVNVMHLAELPGALRQLAIRAALEWVLTKERDVVVVIPEAWQFIPESRNTPAKLAAAEFIRQGAGLRNYLWLDSQDIGGISKELLRSVPVWLVGVQREKNEITRTLDNIPRSARPSADEVMQLELGQFVACWGKHAIRTYVQPAWLPESHARRIARGEEHVDDEYVQEAPPRAGRSRESTRGAGRTHRDADRTPAVSDQHDQPASRPGGGLEPVGAILTRFVQGGQRAANAAIAAATKGGESEMNAQQEQLLHSVVGKVDVLVDTMGKLVRAMERQPPQPSRAAAAPATPAEGSRRAYSPDETRDTEALYQAIKTRLIEELPKDPRVMELVVSQPELRVKVKRDVVTVDGNGLTGRLARLLLDGFFDTPKSGNAARVEMGARGWSHDPRSVYRACDDLTAKGFLRKSGDGYQVVEVMKRNVVEEA